MRTISFRVRVCVLGLTTLTAVVITAAALSPASGNGPTTFTGTSSGAIVTVTNSGTGQAISATGSTSSATGVIYSATSAAGSAAIRGNALSTSLTSSYGVIGSSKNSYGVFALTSAPTSSALFAENLSLTGGGAMKALSAGNAISAASSNASGVVGQTTFVSGSLGTAQAGVLGQDLEATTGFNSGVTGTTTHGLYGVYGKSNGSANAGVAGQGLAGTITGVHGISVAGAGVLGETSSGIASSGVAGVKGIDKSTSGSSNSGVAGVSTNGTGVYGTSTSSVGLEAVNSSDSTPALYVSGGTGSSSFNTYPLVTFHSKDTSISCNGGSQSNIDVFSVDSEGNSYQCGSTNTGMDPLVAHRTLSGHIVGTYAAQQTTQTLEDFGEAQLVNGLAYVRVDPAFTALIDHSTRYMVFITPQGDTPGWLYVSQRTPTGFVVREHGADRSTVAFDYRIGAKPLDASGARLPVFTRPLLGPQPPHTLPQLRAPPREMQKFGR